MKEISEKLEIPPMIMIPILKSSTPSQRLTTVFNLSKIVRSAMRSYICSCHPEWDEEQVEKEVAQRILHGAG